MRDDIVTLLESWRNGDCPAVIVCDQSISSPSARAAAAQKSLVIDLKPFQCDFVGSFTRSVAVVHVIED